jgi:hypothetical protein
LPSALTPRPDSSHGGSGGRPSGAWSPFQPPPLAAGYGGGAPHYVPYPPLGSAAGYGGYVQAPVLGAPRSQQAAGWAAAGFGGSTPTVRPVQPLGSQPGSSAVGSHALGEAGGSRRSGWLHAAWRQFDRVVMQPYFGGRAVQQSPADFHQFGM